MLSKYNTVSLTILPQFLRSDIYFHYQEQYKVCFVVKAYFSVLCYGYSRPTRWRCSQSLAFIMNEIWTAQHLENGTDHHNSEPWLRRAKWKCDAPLSNGTPSSSNICWKPLPSGPFLFSQNVRVFAHNVCGSIKHFFIFFLLWKKMKEK